MSNLPAIHHKCCHAPCAFEYDQEEYGLCYGGIKCVDTTYSEDYSDEYRTAVCDGHDDMYPSYDKTKYIEYKESK